MKKIIAFFFVLLVITLSGCQGNYAAVNLNESVAIPADGIIAENIIQQMKDENAIGSFYGESNGYQYEWTVFGSDIEKVKTVNLALTVQQTEDEVTVTLDQKEPFGFSALLSVSLNELWEAQSATAYQGEDAVVSVSLTGTDQTILNFSVGEQTGSFVIRPDAEINDDGRTDTAVTEEKSVSSDPCLSTPSKNTSDDSYLSSVKDTDEKVYSGTDDTEDNAPVSSTGSGDRKNDASDDYLSAVGKNDDRIYSDGTATEQDQYKTDPVPEGKPMPVEPEDQDVNQGKTYTCTISIECSTILNNLSDLDPDKLEMVPANGVILKEITVTFYEGESVFDLLQRVCKENNIHLESSWTPMYNSAYIEGIHNLYEFDCGALSGWMYRVNGWYPNYGCSRYQLAEGDKIEWRYTCDLGNDIGGKNLF